MAPVPHVEDENFLSNDAFSSIFHNPDHQHLLYSFMNLNLTLSDGRVVSPLQMDAHELVNFCHIKPVQQLAGFIAQLQTSQMEVGHVDSSHLAMRIILSALFVVIGLFGFLGNLCTVMVIIRTPALHSHTNLFLANLALSDLLLISVGVPFDLFYLWRTIGAPHFPHYCEAFSTTISWFTFVSILTIMAMTLERLTGICHVFSWRYIQRKTVVYALVAIWTFAFVPSLWIGIDFKSVIKDLCGIKRQLHSDFGTCDYVGNVEYIFEGMLLLTFVLPILFITACYSRILHTLNAMSEGSQRELKAHVPLTGTSSENSFTRTGQLAFQARASGGFKSQRAQRAVVKMLLIVSSRLFVNYSTGCEQNSLCNMLYPFVGLLQYLSATLNPLIFNLMSIRFRKAFCALWRNFWAQGERQKETMTIPMNLRT
ncbi:G-PROTEIN-RECEP-F1-2 domain-containing protein [Aphelenchoides fujianensis]|nr:G-PROTEIN-RECEP-F1-2 domain-containing protein [Aphelenchoides fujianensis]